MTDLCTLTYFDSLIDYKAINLDQDLEHFEATIMSQYTTISVDGTYSIGDMRRLTRAFKNIDF